MSSEPMGSATMASREQGMELMRAGRFADAAAVLKEATVEDGNDELAWRLLGGARANSGDPIGAAQAFQKAVTLAPTSAKNHYNLALALQANGQNYEAKQHLQQAIALEPGYDQARVRLDEMERAVRQGQNDMPLPSAQGSDDGLAAMGKVRVEEQQTTNIGAGSGDMGGLAPVGSSYTPPTATTTNIGIGSGDMGGLAPVGASFAANKTSGTTNINAGNGDTGGLASLGGGTLPQNTNQPVAPGVTPMPPPSYAGATLYPPPGSGASVPYVQPSRVAPQPVLGMQYQLSDNTSGMKGDVPAEIAGIWNWGAFYFNWIWMLNHGLVGPGLGLLLGFLAIEGVSVKYPAVGFLSLIMRLYLGRSGNKLGWQNRRFQSVEDFRKCERIWAWWVLGFTLGAVALFLIAITIFAAAFASLSGRAH